MSVNLIPHCGGLLRVEERERQRGEVLPGRGRPHRVASRHGGQYGGPGARPALLQQVESRPGGD
jgi:hypothetical protein